MKSFFKNVFLIIALSLAILMIIGICLYDFIPTNSTFAEANTYETNAKTLKVLAEITNDENLNEDGESGNNVVLKEYSVTEADLATYIAKKDYQKGKTDPFSGVGSTNDQNGDNKNNNQSTNNNNNGNYVQGSSNATNSGNSNNSSSNGNQNNNGTTSDGTLLNSKGSK